MKRRKKFLIILLIGVAIVLLFPIKYKSLGMSLFSRDNSIEFRSSKVRKQYFSDRKKEFEQMVDFMEEYPIELITCDEDMLSSVHVYHLKDEIWIQSYKRLSPKDLKQIEKSKIVDVFKTLNMETVIRSSSSAISDEFDLIRFHYKDDVYFDYCISNCNLKDIKEEFRGKIREENKIDDHWVSVYDEIPSI